MMMTLLNNRKKSWPAISNLSSKCELISRTTGQVIKDLLNQVPTFLGATAPYQIKLKIPNEVTDWFITILNKKKFKTCFLQFSFSLFQIK